MPVAILLLASLQTASFLPTRDEALALIREQEAKVRSASFKQQGVEMNITPEGEVGSPTHHWSRSEGIVSRMDLLRVKFRYTDNWSRRVTGSSGYLLSTYDCALDGKEYRSLCYWDRSSETMPLKPQSGTVYGEMQEYFFQSVCGVSCLSLVPAFYRGAGLSRYLHDLPGGIPPWQVLPSDSESVLRIWHSEPRMSADVEVETGYVVSLDLAKDGAITSLEYRVGVPGDAVFEKGEFAHVENVQLVENGGLWLPSSCLYGYSYTNERTGERGWNCATEYTIEWSDINAPVAEEALVLKFPEGLPVTTPLERTGWELYRFFEDNLRYARYWAGSRGKGGGAAFVTGLLLLVGVVVVLVPIVIVRRIRARRARQRSGEEEGRST